MCYDGTTTVSCAGEPLAALPSGSRERRGVGSVADPQGHWRRVLEVQRQIQQHFPECVLVGGTAAALHAVHRVSLDGDHVMEHLRRDFPRVLRKLEALAGCKTARALPPMLILGRLDGVETGIRQLRRTEPLETEVIAGVRVPTLPEMLRIKGWLILTRNATRDFVDFCALAERCGDAFVAALRPMDRLYPQESGETPVRQLAKQLAEPRPYDVGDVDLGRYRGLQPPWDDWANVEAYAGGLARRVGQRSLGFPPRDEGWSAAMEHRHLRDGYDRTVEGVEDILARGGVDDWRALAADVRTEPAGTAARALRAVLDHADMSGTTRLWRWFLDAVEARSRNLHPASRTCGTQDDGSG